MFCNIAAEKLQPKNLFLSGLVSSLCIKNTGDSVRLITQQ